jgi:hypothetical protein
MRSLTSATAHPATVRNMPEFESPNPNSKYSAHGSELIGNLRVYHQGGLDTYCGLYAVLNLINFLKFKESASNHDFIGANKFEKFIGLIEKPFFQEIFSKYPFGGKGIQKGLSEVLNLAFKHFHLGAKATVKEDLSISAKSKRQQNGFRIGAEEPFVPPNSADDVLGVAAVMEDKNDNLQHWVVFVGKSHLTGTDIECANNWNGVVLDSDRGYKFWKIEPEQTQFYVRRQQAQQDDAICWISSFISLTVNYRRPWESEHYEGKVRRLHMLLCKNQALQISAH